MIENYNLGQDDDDSFLEDKKRIVKPFRDISMTIPFGYCLLSASFLK
jgi:hypothetical protein